MHFFHALYKHYFTSISHFINYTLICAIFLKEILQTIQEQGMPIQKINEDLSEKTMHCQMRSAPSRSKDHSTLTFFLTAFVPITDKNPSLLCDSLAAQTSPSITTPLSGISFDHFEQLFSTKTAPIIEGSTTASTQSTEHTKS